MKRSSDAPMVKRWTVALVFAIGLGVPPEARSELLYFGKGGELQIPAEIKGDTVRVEAPDRIYEFQRSDFRKIVPGNWPAREWPERREKSLKGSADDRFRALWWALENGLTPEAISLLRESHRLDPSHAPTARMAATLAKLDKPCSETLPDMERLEAALGHRAELKLSAHVALLHQHTDSDAQERLDLLERVTSTYYLMLSGQGLDLPVPPVRMATAWFARHEDYLNFLHTEKLDVFKSTRGYYHPTLKAVVAYDGRTSGTQKTSRETFANRTRDLEKFEHSIEAVPDGARIRYEARGEPVRVLSRNQARKLHSELSRDLSRRQLLLDQEWRSVDFGVAAHEMVHQLTAASGLAPDQHVFPTWLHEGFAAQFEVVRGGHWAGVGRAHDIRLVDWRKLTSPPLLLTLLENSGFGKGYVRTSYAKAWALVYYLRIEHPREFVSFLDLLRLPSPSKTHEENPVVAAFRASFGTDLDATNRAWREFMAKVQTPLEEGESLDPVPPAESKAP